jgi:hypothetical protein
MANKTRQLSVRVEPEIFETIVRTAKRDSRPIGSVVRLVLEEWSQRASGQQSPPNQQHDAVAA